MIGMFTAARPYTVNNCVSVSVLYLKYIVESRYHDDASDQNDTKHKCSDEVLIVHNLACKYDRSV